MKNNYEITLDEFNKIKNESIIIDVRTPGEVSMIEMIDGATNIPLPHLISKIESVVGKDKTKTIVLVCASGSRSMMAAVMTRDMGYINAVSLKGGLTNF
ncbi:rhodanese-like domain-containing protein [Spiroplasma endosymbiont of Othius punctulatus]|uniref:rhodanese-like domain-containing protein n=1 Tax=Spiroplasma endosymbiont of Othius punctulatus TaxID=3066289 RepID=UPI0030D279E9